MGVLTFEMLTGRLPFIGAIAWRSRTRRELADPSAAKLNAVLPDELDVLLAKVLAKDPAQRPQSVKDLLAQMAKLPQRRAAANAQERPLRRPWRARSRSHRHHSAAGSCGAARVVSLPRAARLAAADPEHRLIERLVGDPDAADDGREAGAGAGPVHPQLACGQPHPRCPRRHRRTVARDRVYRRPGAVRRPGSAQRRAARDAVEYLGRLNEAFETIYGPEAEDQLRAWAGAPPSAGWPRAARDGGAAMAGAWTAAQAGGNRQELQEAMDNVRGEHTTRGYRSMSTSSGSSISPTCSRWGESRQ